MAGVKGRSGGRRPGSGPKRKAPLLLLHTMIDSIVGSADWASIVAALVKKAKQGDVPPTSLEQLIDVGDVQAFRELRTCRFGHLPEASRHLAPTVEKEDGDLYDLANFVDTGLPGAQPDTGEETG
jgi:hypothetical protein